MNIKILFIHDFSSPDYLPDSIYHGLIDSNFLVDCTTPPYNLYRNSMTYAHCHNLYGKLEGTFSFPTGQILWERIQSNYYDFVIYGNIRKDSRFFWTDINNFYTKYKKSQIHFLDGEDDTLILTGLERYGTLWKRELINDLANPISFSIPESQLINSLPEKSKLIATVIPGKKETYIFPKEKDYNLDYQKSYYGITHKKSGWDCMRHYEILANRCIPYFADIEDCPKNTLTHLPKDLLKKVNLYSFDDIQFNYEELESQFYDWTASKLTTKKMVLNIIK